MRNSVLLSLGLVLTGCSSASTVPDDEPVLEISSQEMNRAVPSRQTRPPAEVAPGYEIVLSSVDDPSLDGKYRIELDGSLKLPYKQKIQTSGLSREKLHDRIVEAFSKFYKTRPTISMSVIADQYWVEVRGLVEKPGRFLIKPLTSLDEVLAMAGGLQKNSPPSFVRVQQGRKNTTVKLSEYYAGSSDAVIPQWEGGDIVFLQSDRGEGPSSGEAEKTYVQIVGEVRTPGEYRYIRGADFYHYLVKAGGPTSGGDLTAIEIVRDTNEGKVLTRFAYEDGSDIPAIQAGDLIVLLADKPTTLERTVPIVSGLVGIMNTVLLLFLIL